jgi:hypothetical protein
MLKDVNKKKAAAVILLFLSLGLNAQKIETHGTTDGSREHVHVEGDTHQHAPNSTAQDSEKSRTISLPMKNENHFCG